MTDFIDRFEAQLVATAPRPLPWHVRARRWIAAHAVASVLIVGAVGATTTAAAVATLHGSPSRPLTAPLTRTDARGVVVADGRYVIRVSPSPAVGQPGWCEMAFFLRKGPHGMSGGGSCGLSTPTRSQHIGASSFSGDATTSMVFFMVDDRVAGIRLRNGHVVLARTDPALPSGWKAVVVFSGDPGVGRFTNRALAHWQLLDEHGLVLGRGDEVERADQLRGYRPQAWIPVDGAAPDGAACRIEALGGGVLPRPVLTSIFGRWGLRPVDDVDGDPPLACGRVIFGDDTHPQLAMHATVYVDTHRPGLVRPARFPGLMGPDDGRVGRVAGWASGMMPLDPVGPEPGATIQRRGNAWLVVDGGTSEQQAKLMGQLRVSVRPGPNEGAAARIARRVGAAADARAKHFR